MSMYMDWSNERSAFGNERLLGIEALVSR